MACIGQPLIIMVCLSGPKCAANVVWPSHMYACLAMAAGLPKAGNGGGGKPGVGLLAKRGFGGGGPIFPPRCNDLPLTTSSRHPWWLRHCRQERRGRRTTDLR